MWNYLKRCSFFVVVFLTRTLGAQHIDGTYDPIKHTFKIKETKYMKSVYEVMDTCVNGYCPIRDENYRRGIIDTGGWVIMEPSRFHSLEIKQVNSGVYYLASSYGTPRYLFNQKGTLLDSSQRVFVYLYSHEKGEVFFKETQENRDWSRKTATGTIMSYEQNRAIQMEFERDYVVDVKNSSDDFPTATDFFASDKLMYKDSGRWIVREFNGTRLYENLEIKQVVPAYTLSFVVPEYPHRYCLLEAPALKKIQCFDAFDYGYSNRHYIIFSKGNSMGALVFREYAGHGSDTVLNVFELPCIFDSVRFDDNLHYRHDALIAHKGDTLFKYDLTNFYGDFNYRKNFNEVYKVRKNGNYVMIGHHGSWDMSEYRLKPSDFIPKTPFVGLSYGSIQFLQAKPGDTGYLESVGMEAGIGWYTGYSESKWFSSEWAHGGIGMSLEYRAALGSTRTYQERSGQPFSPLLFNVRAEFGAGAVYCIVPLAIQLQMGYTTDFKHGFFRPGIGVCLPGLDLGAELMIRGDMFPNVRRIGGFYLRYLFLDYD